MEKNKAMIFVNGDLKDISRLRSQITADTYLVAVDGGLRHLKALGLKPDLLVGDMDSVSLQDLAEVKKSGIEIRQYPVEKDETDLELALEVVLVMGFDQIKIAAALGGRLDQTLGNLFLLRRMDLVEKDIRLDDGVEEIFLIRNQIVVEGKKGDSISLLPLSKAVQGVITKGLKYPINDETLFAEKTRGISNEMLSNTAHITVKSGVLICIHDFTAKNN
ncbi:MAG: thiamine diphosphokinase [Anaerolineaceae bacterium]|nr:thiamine diphosphokinase [Anaerolineaceae bacterium]